MTSNRGVAVVTGAGPGLGASVCRRLVTDGYQVTGLTRSGTTHVEGDGFSSAACDITDPQAVIETIKHIESTQGPVDVLVHNAGAFLMKPFTNVTHTEFETMWRVNCYGGMLVSSAVLPGMKARGDGTIIFTGATASARGGAQFAAFASSKFALRGLAQSLAREHGPLGVHVVHVIIDGIINTARTRGVFDADPSTSLDPDAIATVYSNLVRQDRSAWTHEIDLRPFAESF